MFRTSKVGNGRGDENSEIGFKRKNIIIMDMNKTSVGWQVYFALIYECCVLFSTGDRIHGPHMSQNLVRTVFVRNGIYILISDT